MISSERYHHRKDPAVQSQRLNERFPSGETPRSRLPVFGAPTRICSGRSGEDGSWGALTEPVTMSGITRVYSCCNVHAVTTRSKIKGSEIVSRTAAIAAEVASAHAGDVD